MLIALVAARLLQTASPPTAADFFPLVTGQIRTFVSGGNVTTEEVLPPITIDGKPAIPVVQRDTQQVIGTIYYRVEPGIIYLLGYNNPKKLLSEPMPILEFDGHSAKWTCATANGEGALRTTIAVTGQSRSIRQEEVLGKQVPIVEVTLDALVGEGKGQEHSRQIIKYAAGVGMYEMTATSQIGKKHTAGVVRRLIKVEGAKSNG